MRNLRASGVAEVRHAIARAVLESVDIDERLGSVVLRPSQVDSAKRLIRLLDQSGGALLADPVGTGKTYTALAVVARLGLPTTLVIPAALRDMWTSALSRSATPAELVTHESSVALERWRVPDR